jgi:glycosyltransferase involved in cell wall biosynthesis
MKLREKSVAFVINGDTKSTMTERARAFATRLGNEFLIDLVFREGNRALATLQMFRAISRLRPRLVYVFDMSFAGVAAGIAHRALFRSKLIIDTGDAIYELARSMGRGAIGLALTRLLQWASFRFADVIVTRGSFHAELLAKRGLKAVWIPDGVDLAQFTPREQPQLRIKLAFDGKLVVGLIGTSRWSERLQMCYGWELVEVVNILRDQPVLGVLIGDGSGLPRLRARCKEYGIEDKVLFLGRLPFDQLPDYLAVFDVCLSTQTNDLVGQVRTTGKLPLYLACDRLVLASNVGEAKKILPNDMLIEFEGSRDIRYPARLAERIASLLRNRAALNQAGAMRKLARLHFDYDLLAKKMAELFVT